LLALLQLLLTGLEDCLGSSSLGVEILGFLSSCGNFFLDGDFSSLDGLDILFNLLSGFFGGGGFLGLGGFGLSLEGPGLFGISVVDMSLN
jgi:hypothetical protein